MSTCPRRMQELGPWEYKEDLDNWFKIGSEYTSCSFCGSMDPEDFLELMRSGAGTLGSTDKNYKVYINLPGEMHKFYFMHFDKEQKMKFIDLYNNRKINKVSIGYPGYLYTTPFFCVLDRGGDKDDGSGTSK